MTDLFPPLSARNHSKIRKLLLATREASSLMVLGSDSSNPARAPSGEEFFLLAVPAEIRDLLYAQLVELQERNRKLRAGRKYVSFAGWRLDLFQRRLIAPEGGITRLPGSEYALLRAFVGRPRHLLSRFELVIATERTGRPNLSTRTVDSYVSRLRKRLSNGGGALLISTVPRVGYSFDADVA